MGILSGDIVQRDCVREILSGRKLFGGYCLRGYCPGGKCLRNSIHGCNCPGDYSPETALGVVVY